tara:strand:- start:2484 stop:4100 length:1617 start_codon:yes stop_codon:yes gene_type:complete
MVTTPNASNSSGIVPESLKDHKELLSRLDQYASTVLCNEEDPLKRLQLLRLYADEVGFPLNERTAALLLSRAAGTIAGVAQPRKKGERLDTSAVPWAWEGVIMSGTFNLLVAPPKVGKSALMVGMISAWFHGEESYLGQRLHGVCPKVYIVGTDQPESDWFTLFKREGLVTSDGELGGPVEMLWHTGAPLHLTDEGISHLGEIAAENPGSLFLLDSYHACCAVLGLEEAASSFDGPARKLAEALAPHKATLTMIHHTNKSVSGGNATQASRGSNALPAAASLTILMNWFKQPAEGQTQNDHRVVVKTQGRAKGTTLLIELQDDGWIHHGDGESVLAAEAMQEAADELQGRQADVFDYIKDRWILGNFTVAGTEISARFNLEANKTSRCLRALVRKGLLEEAGLLDAGPSGGRPSVLYRPAGASSSDGCETSETCETSASITWDIGLTPLTPLTRKAGGCSVEGGLTPPVPGTPVELHRNGDWNNGWVVSDASDLHAVRVAKLGSPNVTVGKLRWELDVRPCQSSPFKADPVEPDPFDF